MAQITASMVKELREKTGAGMMDCKKALAENDGDMEKSVEWLRKKGIAKAAKKAGRVAAEGLVAAATEGTKGAVVEVNSETDFVARNEDFQNFVEQVARLALDADGDFDKLLKMDYPGTGRNVADEVTALIGVIGENITLRRTAGIQVSKGLVASYVHNAVKPGLGKIAVIVGLESEGKPEALQAIGKQIAMHVAASRPEAVTTEGVSQEAIDKERAVLKEQALASGKPENVVEKMVEGRLRKFYEEIVLLEQVFVIDGKAKVKEALKEAEKEAGAPITVTGFASFVLGEGIEKEESDFAAEVAAAANG